MKKIIFVSISILFFVFQPLHAQNTGWESGINVSGGALFGTGTSNVSGKNFRWHYGAGIYGRKFWKEKFGLELGAQFSQYSDQIHSENLYFGSQVTPTGYIGPPSTYKGKLHSRLIEIPVRFVFKKDMGKFGIGCFVGAVPGFLVNAISHTSLTGYEPEEFDKKENKISEYRRFTVLGDVGLLLRANISQHFSLDTRPFYRMSILNERPGYRYATLGVAITSVWKF